MLLVYGFNKLRYPEIDDSLFTFLKSYPPHLVGGICIAVAFAILASTLDRWAKMLPGLFVYAILRGLLAVAGGGFHSRIASLQLTQLEAAMMAALFAACALLTMRFTTGALNWVDRASALSGPMLLTWGMTSNNAATGFKVLSLIVAFYGAAAAYDYGWCRRHSKRKTV